MKQKLLFLEILIILLSNSIYTMDWENQLKNDYNVLVAKLNQLHNALQQFSSEPVPGPELIAPPPRISELVFPATLARLDAEGRTISLPAKYSIVQNFELIQLSALSQMELSAQAGVGYAACSVVSLYNAINLNAYLETKNNVYLKNIETNKNQAVEFIKSFRETQWLGEASLESALTRVQLGKISVTDYIKNYAEKILIVPTVICFNPQDASYNFFCDENLKKSMQKIKDTFESENQYYHTFIIGTEETAQLQGGLGHWYVLTVIKQGQNWKIVIIDSAPAGYHLNINDADKTNKVNAARAVYVAHVYLKNPSNDFLRQMQDILAGVVPSPRPTGPSVLPVVPAMPSEAPFFINESKLTQQEIRQKLVISAPSNQKPNEPSIIAYQLSPVSSADKDTVALFNALNVNAYINTDDKKYLDTMHQKNKADTFLNQVNSAINNISGTINAPISSKEELLDGLNRLSGTLNSLPAQLFPERQQEARNKIDAIRNILNKINVSMLDLMKINAYLIELNNTLRIIRNNPIPNAIFNQLNAIIGRIPVIMAENANQILQTKFEKIFQLIREGKIASVADIKQYADRILVVPSIICLNPEDINYDATCDYLENIPEKSDEIKNIIEALKKENKYYYSFVVGNVEMQKFKQLDPHWYVITLIRKQNDWQVIIVDAQVTAEHLDSRALGESNKANTARIKYLTRFFYKDRIDNFFQLISDVRLQQWWW